MARGTAGLLALSLGAALPATAQLRPVEVPISGRAGIDSLARLGFEVANVRAVDGSLRATIVVSPETEGLLAQRGYRTEQLIPRAPLVADTFRMFRSFDRPGDGIRATLNAWAATDTLMHVDSVGASYEGRPILAVKIGPPGDAPDRPNVLFMATHHAREWISTAVALELIRWLADSGGTIVATHDVWIIPVENPDGYQYTFTNDRYWRKNRRPNANGSFGVDLNRNYPAFWGLDERGSSGAQFAETYRGTGPGSEPETQAVIAFHAAHPPVISLSYHSYSGLVLYPWGFRTATFAPDLPRFEALAGTDLAPAIVDNTPQTSIAHYHPGPGWNLYPTNGEYTDWAYRTHGTFSFTVELTSGCCAQAAYYGFEFPDDSALVDRVFRDNLPFALSLIAASGDLGRAPGVSGLTPAAQRFTSLWPEAWLSLDASSPGPTSLMLRTRVGGLSTRSAQTDSLSRGTLRTTWRSDLRLDGVRALRAEGTGVSAELITIAGAEPLDAGWQGWYRDTLHVAGQYSWYTAGKVDTLTSPVVDLRGQSGIWLQFWTRHFGSTFTPEQSGVVQFSPDSGRSWSDVAVIVGEGGSWYPMRVDLPPQADGARGAQLRFISNTITWWIDAVGYATDASAAFAQTQTSAPVAFSENPVRSDQVVISWPPGASDARLEIFTFTGERIHSALIAPPSSEYVWDLHLGGGNRRVVNGAYIVMVTVGGQHHRRRLFIDRPAP
ncbi:MAG TPA: M14 family metallopeptidase [Gemmatimonadales bacterium]|nr:M14 family metallopeptidase [Gemmatimonadales bacterium]